MQSSTKKVNVEKLTEEELQKVQELISSRVSNILNKADKDINKLLSRYGLKAQIFFEMSRKE
jgi:hypothetical protein